MILKSSFLAIILFFFALRAFAGSFNVLPIKIFLSDKNKVDSLRVKNEGTETVTVQVKAVLWSVDEKGADAYLPTEELVYMPRIFTLNGKEERMIKIAFDGKQAAEEKSFRVFVEEVSQAKAEGEGAQLQMALRIGIPVFVAPLKNTPPTGSITDAVVAKGKLSFMVRNQGAAHFMEKSIKLTGLGEDAKVEFSDAVSGWYVLAGKNKPHSKKIPTDVCGKLRTITLEIELDSGVKLKNTITVDKKACEI